ncbi:hypothetical protein IAQ61_002356 [Plenodomus lingam]|uniref:Predicted protein n=1 Tax=Leptosphaeria maculans (strain JN3 / isolate v23.1.3 / race Av1-4-5-6-7-8) TaxID=985895 RepID=E4ZHQ2_LEPMJ|nr:predicted protein [Plenodomus lingam JN3]KAH9876995.1 hypothetical protein IAQ61_002356 [Plenodomus lingam]CBX90885.1 predicted protein [Plenodomus lingam JN3]
MAEQATATLASLPLEVRHNIFAHAASRPFKAKNLLRYWFEKQDAKQQISELAADHPAGPAPRVIYCADAFDGDSEISDCDEYDEAEGEENSQEAENDEYDEDDDGQPEHDDYDTDDDVDEHDETMEEDEDDQATAVVSVPSTQTQNPAPVPTQVASGNFPGNANSTNGSQSKEQDGLLDDEDDNDDEEDEMASNEDEQDELDETGDNGYEYWNENWGEDSNDEADDRVNDGEDAATDLRSPIIHVPAKWRHVPNFMRLSQCPPSVELFLISQQFSTEAKDWFYNVAVLHIEATASFAHTSFVEEAVSQITKVAFSPIESIRKIEVTFVWDSAWMHTDTTGYVDEIFPALLRQRTSLVIQILQQAPELREVIVHWHDSAQEDADGALRLDVFEYFVFLNANVQFKEYYVAGKPKRNSIVGRQRMEYQNILDQGLGLLC